MKTERVIHIELGASAADVICWMRSLPTRTINLSVNEILSAESKGKIAQIPCKFSYTSKAEPLSCQLVIRGETALDLAAKIPKGQLKSTIVKIIRKHIRKNKEIPPSPVGIRSDLLLEVLKNFMTKMEEKESEYAGVPNKYRKLCEANDMAYRALLNGILVSYKAVDENQGDYNLRHLDYERIISDSFDSAFGVIEKHEDLDKLLLLLEFGLPDEEYKEIIEKLKERNKNV